VYLLALLDIGVFEGLFNVLFITANVTVNEAAVNEAINAKRRIRCNTSIILTFLFVNSWSLCVS
jgi:hypothetical protein